MFNNPYEVILADTPETKRVHFNLRYQVYCEETGYEDLSQFPDEMEMDAYDDHSAHFIVRCKETNEWVAAMRLVLQKEEGHTIPVLDHEGVDDEFLPVCEKALEISRLCILKPFRGARARRVVSTTARNDTVRSLHSAPENRKLEAKRECTIMLSLIKAAFAYGKENKINTGIALMAAPLARILRMSGFDVDAVGPQREFRGKRRPYLFNLKTVASNFLKIQSTSVNSAYTLGSTEKALLTLDRNKLSA